MLRRYPWFSDNLFQDSFGADASSFWKEKFISCIQQRDLAWGMRSDQAGYERWLEVYHPNFCGRQLGFRQAIPVPFFDLVHCRTFYCLLSPLEATFQASRHSLEVMTKIAHKPTTFNFECSALFTTWWEARRSNMVRTSEKPMTGFSDKFSSSLFPKKNN